MAENTNTGYELSRAFFDWCFENPEKINPNHGAIFFFAVEHCNRLGWKEKFGFPTQMAMDAIGIKKHDTYIKYFNDLVEWGFFKLIQKSQNQYSSNIISLGNGNLKNGNTLSKATLKHGRKQPDGTGESNPESNRSINKHITYNQEPLTKNNANAAKPPLVGYEVCLNFWLKDFHPGWEFNGTQGKALKSILKKLEKKIQEKNGAPPGEMEILDAFRVMCLNLPEWHKAKDMNILDQKFNEIIEEIKNEQSNRKAGRNTISELTKFLTNEPNVPSIEEIKSGEFSISTSGSLLQ